MADLSTPSNPLSTAVLFLIFNRPDTTAKVFEEIRRAKPPRLYVAADGARDGREGENDRVESARSIATAIDWPCEIKTLFRDKNLGCKRAVGEAITWFFEHEEQGIILEDDCLPHADFFRFTEVVLDRYRDDERVSVVTGDNFQDGKYRGSASYYFSKYNHCWGWASWRRAWRHYQGDIPFWPEWSQSADWCEKMPDPVERRYWAKIFERVHAGGIDTWDYPWTASLWFQGGLTATPNVNLVSNIGFGPDSTHTRAQKNPLAAIPIAPIGEIIHPAGVERCADADKYLFDYSHGGRSLSFPYTILSFPRRIIRFLRRLLGKKIA
ncbi:glycosyltransferase family 2 protein [Haliea sp. E1-2-M8]|uniref:glycosyltransferase family 2 protein n=1 Tax=Haliea sp. E1-2-M8 TaxID=3064706 RepID=UPI002726C563|nr:glycosyltransferase family 2 protein [Haliea sp. E1-2-M8]MDO8863358.1 glycosyltransferase family 2 protein [Haliea sp. E1-2-M8]